MYVFFFYLQHAPLHPVILHARWKLYDIYSIYIFAKMFTHWLWSRYVAVSVLTVSLRIVGVIASFTSLHGVTTRCTI